MPIRYLSGLSVDSTVLVVDAANDRVGIGTATPSDKLQVNGGVTFGGDTVANNRSRIYESFGLNLESGAASRPIIFRTTLVERMRITDSGFVGIGTTNPLEKLSVDGAIGILSGGTQEYHIVYLSGGLSFTESGIADGRLFLKDGGNVGIGTTSPSYKTSVVAANGNYWNGTAFTGTPLALSIENSSPGGYDPVLIYNQADSGGTLKNSGAIGMIGTAAWTAGDNAAQVSDMYFLVRNSSGGISERLRIKSTGAAQLKAYGSGSFTGTVAYNLAVDSSGNIIETAGGVVDGSGTANYVTKWIDGNTVGNSLIYDDGTTITFQTGASERMRITSGGSVLIATSTNPYTLGSLVVSHDSTLTRTYFQRGVELIEIVPSDGTGPNIISSSYTSSGSAYKPLSLSGRQNNADLYLTTNGNVGIGTTNPGAKLDVNGDAWFTNGGSLNAVITQGAAGKGRLYLYDGGNATIGLQTNGPSYFNAGNVGIGTTAPAHLLSIYGPPVSDGALNVVQKISSNAASSTIPTSGLGFGANYTTGGDNAVLSGIAGGKENATSGDFAGVLNFYTRPNGGDHTERMRITSTGNVGIGTTSPAYKLDVAGTISNNSAQNIIYASYDAVAALFQRVGTYGGVIQLGRSGVSNSTTIDYPADGTFAVSTASSERMRITSAGNVGIGTTSPATKLDVNGGINIANGNNLTWGGTYAAGIPTIAGYNAGTGGALHFYPNGSTSGEKMRLHASGNLSIGNTNDTYKLDVTGQGRFTHSAGVPALDIRASDTNFALMSIFGNQAGDVNWLLMSGYPAAGDFTIRQSDTVNALTLTKTTGAATFSSSVTASSLIKSGGTSAQYLMADGSVSTLTNPVTGTGTTNYVPKWTSGSAIGDSGIFDTSGNIVINGTTAINVSSNRGNITINGTSAILNFGISNVESGYIFHNGTNLDIAQVLAQPLRFLTTNAERMRITAGGNVGIGTTSPSEKLELSASGNIYGKITSTTTGGNAGVRFLSTGAREYGIFTDGDLRFYDFSASAERMRITSGGNVGIGTTAPGAKLDIVSTGTGSEGLRVDGASGGFAFVVKGGSDYTSHIRAGATIGVNYFTTPPSNGLIVEGSVGIGTTAPNAQLDVYTTQGGSTIAATHGTGGTYPKASGISFGATSTSLSVSNNGGTVVFTGGAGIYANNNASSNNPTDLILWTTSGGTPAARLTIASNGPATFSSSVAATSAAFSGNVTITTANTPELLLTHSNTSKTFLIAVDGSNAFFRANSTNNILFQVAGGTTALTLASSQAATFSSSVTASSLIKSGGTSAQYLMADGSVSTLTNPVTGTGTANYIPKFTSSSAIGNSIIQDNATGIIIGGTDNYTAQNGGWFFNGASSYTNGIFASSSSNNLTLRAPQLISFESGGAQTMLLNASGNLGLGVTPSAWAGGAGRTALQVGITSVSTNTANDSFYGTNYYDDGTNNRYINTDFSLIYAQQNGNHIWYNAPSGTAGNVITFTQPMTLAATGNLLIGTTTDAGHLLYVNGTARFNGVAYSASRLMVGITSDQTYASIFVAGDITTGGSQYAILIDPQLSGTNNYGLLANARIKASHAATNAYGVYIVNNETLSGASIVNNYGLYIADQTRGSSVNYALYSAGGTSYFAGNVGIGTTTPVTKLHVYSGNSGATYYHEGIVIESNGRAALNILSGAANDGYVFFGNSTAGNAGYIGYENTNNNLVLRSSDYISLLDSTGTVVRIDGGNVGIGTTSPGGQLSIFDTNNSRAYQMSFGYETTETFRLGNNNATGKFTFTQLNNSNGFRFTSVAPNSTGIIFDINTSQFAVNGDTGNVGIGTTIPGSRLQVTATSNSATTVDNGITILNDSGVNNCLAGIRLSTYGDADGGLYPKQFIGAIRDGAFGAGKGSIVFCNRDAADTSVVALSDEKMRILPSGNVGIGTTSPNNIFTIYAASSAIFTQWIQSGTGTTSTDGLRIGLDASSNGIINLNEGTALITSVDGSERMRITAAGNVGIGTTAPQKPLEVITSASNFASVGVNTIAIGEWTGIHFGYREANNSYRKSAIVFERTGNAAEGKIHFLNNIAADNSSATLSDSKMVISDNGNVGIGTTAPANKLEVDGGSSAVALRVSTTNTGVGVASLILSNSSKSAFNDGVKITHGAGYTNVTDLAGTSVMVWDMSNTRVGIGTTSTSSTYGKLTVAGGISTTDDSNSKLQLGRYSSGFPYGYIKMGANTSGLRITNPGDTVDVFTILSGGNVGIGTDSPSEKLHVDGSTLITYNNSFQSTNSVGNKAILARVSPTAGIVNYAEYATATNLNGFVIGSDDARVKGNITGDSLEFITNTSTRMTVLSSGNVGINTTNPGSTLHVIGDVLIQTGALGVGVNPDPTDGRIDASNDIVAFNSSDRRLKENITPIANALEKVRSLTGVEFDWKEETKKAHGHSGRDTGVIAQEVQAIMPTAVRTNNTGYLAVRYEKLIGLLIEGMKEQQAQIDELKAQINDSPR